MKTILVTGGAGFIGSNFIRYILSRYSEYGIINFDNLTYAGNLNNLVDVEGDSRYRFIRGDISNRTEVNNLFSKNSIDIVVNFAAESHVDRSIEDPTKFISTNILGTAFLLEASKNHWVTDPDGDNPISFRRGVKFLQVSTDEVYGSLGSNGKFNERMDLKPNSPYSASKASADLITRSYFKTFGLPVNITRCSNNYGPFQFPEKLIPLMINNCMNDQPLPVYGDGMQIRDWLHVMDHCSAIDKVIHNGKTGEVYNIGGNNEKANIEIVKIIIEHLGKSESLIKYVTDRLGHDRRYAIDNEKITTELGWSPTYTFEKGMQDTITWYLENKKWISEITSGDYKKYYDRMYGEMKKLS
jgi:dTDP-glucose 4,6-dehydratase